MSLEKAKEFLDHLSKNKELQSMFSGFTSDELKTASKKTKNSKLKPDELDKIDGGGSFGPHIDCIVPHCDSPF